MKRWLLILLVIAFFALHQDVWNWRTAHPLVFGLLPIGLAYHAGYCVAASLLMWLLVKVEGERMKDEEQDSGVRM